MNANTSSSQGNTVPAEIYLCNRCFNPPGTCEYYVPQDPTAPWDAKNMCRWQGTQDLAWNGLTMLCCMNDIARASCRRIILPVKDKRRE